MIKILCTFCCLLLGIFLTACGREEVSKPRTDSAAVAEPVEISDYGENEKIFYPTEKLNVNNTPMAEGPAGTTEYGVVEQTKETTSEDNTVSKMNVQVGNTTFSATLEENIAVNELVQMMQEAPIVLNMSDYSGFEKVGSLKTNLTASNSQINTQAGDIVLYNGNQIVIFYGSHSWSYTRIAKIDDLSGWAEALGSGDVQVTFRVVE